jgi:protein disulfide isomerase family A protein 3
MDATANDVPPKYEVRGWVDIIFIFLQSFQLIHFVAYLRFPTLFWLPKGKRNSPVPYNGGRELDDFIKFIARESTDGLKGYSRDGKKIKKKSEL